MGCVRRTEQSSELASRGVPESVSHAVDRRDGQGAEGARDAKSALYQWTPTPSDHSVKPIEATVIPVVTEKR